MKKKIAKKKAAALGNMRNIRKKQKQKYVSKCIIKMGLKCAELQKRNRKQMYDQLKRR